jgi:putative flippase GtrA
VLDVLKSRQCRYLTVGGANTVFGYLIGILAYKLLSPGFSIWTIGFVGNLFAITFSFVTYKLFVFKTQGQWIEEYFKAYLVYGSMALVGIVLLWLYVDMLNMTIWLAQGLVIVSTVILSYVGHSRFTFRRKEI